MTTSAKSMVEERPVPPRDDGPLSPKSNANYLTEDGREKPDPTPMAPPIGYKRQPSLAEQIRAMVRSEALAAAARNAGAETFEEADDFDVGDDFDPSSPYEDQFDPVPVGELKRRRDAYNAEIAKREAAAAKAKAKAAAKAAASTDSEAESDPPSGDDHS